MKLIKEIYNNVFYLNEHINLIKNDSFETISVKYIKKILLLSFFGALIIFLINLFKSLLYYYIYDIKIEVINFLNYNLSKSVGIFFAYFIILTLGILLIGFILNIFLKDTLIRIYTKIFIALEPIILFGAVPLLIPGLLFWCIQRYIFVSKNIFGLKKIKGTIEQRE
jgi:hypothetical protein